MVWPLLQAVVAKKILARLGGRLPLTVSGEGRLAEELGVDRDDPASPRSREVHVAVARRRRAGGDAVSRRQRVGGYRVGHGHGTM